MDQPGVPGEHLFLIIITLKNQSIQVYENHEIINPFSPSSRTDHCMFKQKRTNERRTYHIH